MTRKALIELIRRQVYGSQPSNDAELTVNLVNRWLDFAIATAAKQNYKENIAIDGISFVNNSFYTTFKGIAVTKDEQFVWKITLPQIPIGIGATEGISTVVFKDADTAQISYPVILISENQRSFSKGMRNIPNKLVGYPQGGYVYVESTLQLSNYTATVTMISGGTSTDLTSTVNVPDDYMPIIVEYMKQQLMFQRNVVQDVQNDGLDAIRTT